MQINGRMHLMKQLNHNKILAQMAYLARKLVQGLCLYSVGRLFNVTGLDKPHNPCIIQNANELQMQMIANAIHLHFLLYGNTGCMKYFF